MQSVAPDRLNLPAVQLLVHVPFAVPYMPLGQSLHMLAPAGLRLPAWHSKHAPTWDAPGRGAYMPLAHTVQLTGDVEPASGAYLPASQSLHLVCGSGEYCPAGHSVHDTEPEAPSRFVTEPLAHSSQPTVDCGEK